MSKNTTGSALAEITTVILAGGLGSRLRPVVPDRPKVLAEVNGRPFLFHVLDLLADAGIREAVLCTGHMADQVMAALGDNHRGLRLSYSHEATPLGTGGALRRALPRLRSDPVLVLNGDSYIDTDLLSFWEWYMRKRAGAAAVLTSVDNSGRYGEVTVGQDGAIHSFREKNSGGRPGLINAGIYLLPMAVIEKIPPDTPFSLERDLFPALIQQGFHGYICPGSFLDIGTPASYGTADNFFSRLRG